MRTAVNVVVALLAVVVAALLPAIVAGQARGSGSAPAAAVPESIQTEHHAIHEALTNATGAPGAVGAAARELAALLDPHFKREEEIALPPLGLLAPLAAGQNPAGMEKVLAMSDALRKELPRMLGEHQRIRAATERLRVAARAQKLVEHERFAEELALHAQTEEEVLYPAAVLVGDIIRARLGQK